MQMPPAELETAFQFIIDNRQKMKIVNAAGESVAPTLPLKSLIQYVYRDLLATVAPLSHQLSIIQ